MVQITPGASSLSHQLAVTFFNINDMQAAALYVGQDCIARSDTIPVSAIESVFKALTKKPQMTKSIIEKRNEALSPAMTWNDTLGNLETLDNWRKSVGYKLPQE